MSICDECSRGRCRYCGACGCEGYGHTEACRQAWRDMILAYPTPHSGVA